MTNYFEVDKVITCSGTAPIASTAVDIYAIKVGKDPLLVKKALAVSGGNWTTTITVPKTYVAPFGEVYLKVVDSYNPTIAGTKFYTIDPTLTIDAITGMEAGVKKAVTGTSNHVGQKVELESRLSGQTPEDSWTPEGNATVGELGTWSIDVTIANASTRDFRIIDENIDPDVCNAQVDGVVVEAGYIIPTNEKYDDYVVGSGITPRNRVGDVFASLADSDEIIVTSINTGAASDSLSLNRIDATAKSLVAIYSDGSTNGQGYGYANEAINTTDCISLYAFATNYTSRCKYLETAARIAQTNTGGEKICGIVKIGADICFLLNDGKIYSSSNYTDFTLKKDISAIVGANDTIKPCAYDATNNYLFVLNLSTQKIYCIDYVAGTQLGAEFTPPEADIRGICHHAGRLICSLLDVATSKIRIIVLKNSDDA